MATWLRWLLGASKTVKEDNKRNVITMFGPCRVTLQEGRFHCFCKAGAHLHPSTSIDLNELCSTCDHPLVEHEDVPGTLCFIRCTKCTYLSVLFFEITRLIWPMNFPHSNQNRPVPLRLFLLDNRQIRGSPIPYPCERGLSRLSPV